MAPNTKHNFHLPLPEDLHEMPALRVAIDLG